MIENRLKILHNLTQIINSKNIELMSKRLHQALVGYLLNWPICAILTPFQRSIFLDTFIHYVKQFTLTQESVVYRIVYHHYEQKELIQQLSSRMR